MKRITKEDLLKSKPVKPTFFFLKKFLLMNIFSLMTSIIGASLIWLVFSVLFSDMGFSTNFIEVFVLGYILTMITQLFVGNGEAPGYAKWLCGLKKYTETKRKWLDLVDEYERQQNYIKLSEEYKNLE